MSIEDDKKIIEEQTVRYRTLLSEYIEPTNFRVLDKYAFNMAYNETRRQHIEKWFPEVFIVRRCQIYEESLDLVRSAKNPKRNMLEVTFKRKSKKNKE